MSCTEALTPQTDTPAMKATKESEATGLPWQLALWKSRLPIVAVPVMASLRSLALNRSEKGLFSEGWLGLFAELGVITGLVVVTGRLRLPFTVTWWLILLACFALETPFILGTATVLSMSVLIGWYSVRIWYPHSVSVLWGGSRMRGKEPKGIVRLGWQAWDLVVHMLPATLMVYWYGFNLPGGVWATVTAAPLNIIWLWSFGFGLPAQSGDSWLQRRRIYPWGLKLAQANEVYRVEPGFPDKVWAWFFGSHLLICSFWASMLLLPTDVTIAYTVFILHGIFSIPFTNGWWTIFIMSLFSNSVGPVFRGITACCAATVFIGWYGTQILIPYCFQSLVRSWVVKPACKLSPPNISAAILKYEVTIFRAARVGDMFLHFLPTLTAGYLFYSDVTPVAALAAIPCNILYLFATGSVHIEDTNRIYDARPDPPYYVWQFIYGGHIVFCVVSFLVALVLQWRS